MGAQLEDRAKDGEPAHAGLSEALQRAWSAFQIYGDDHPSFASAAADVVNAGKAIDEAQRHLLLDPGSPGLGGASTDSFDRALCALDIGAVQLGDGLDAATLALALSEIRAARGAGERGSALADRVSASCDTAVKLVPLNYARLSERVTGVRPNPRADRDTRLGVGELRSVLLGATSQSEQRDAAAWIGRAISDGGADARSVSQSVQETIREARRTGGEASDDIEHIRGVLASLSPEIRAGLIHDQGGPDLDAISELAGVIPVMETCEALASAQLSPDSICHSTLMMFQRLATLSAGRAAELGRVESLAALVVGDNADSQEAQALQSLRNLCHEARREEFTPKEYLDRLHEISAGQIGVAASLPDFEWETDAQERVHAAKIILELIDANIGAEHLRAGHLRALTGAVPHIAALGRPDLLSHVSDACASFAHHPDDAIRDEWSRLQATLEDDSTRAIALSSTTSEDLFESGADRLAQQGERVLIRVLLTAHALGPGASAAPWIAARLASTGPALGAEIGAMLESSPETIEVLLSLINGLDRDAAFEAIQPALLNHRDDEARRRAYSAAYTLRHPWPRDLCHAALVEPDDRIRALGVAYVLRRSPDDLTPLLTERLLHTLGGPAPTPQDRAMIIDSLARADSDAARRALTQALIGAAWRASGTSPELGRALARGVRSNPAGSRSALALLLWSVCPNRFISSVRRLEGAPDVG